VDVFLSTFVMNNFPANFVNAGNLSLDRKLKVLSFMEFFNYDYHAEKYEVIGREMSIA